MRSCSRSAAKAFPRGSMRGLPSGSRTRRVAQGGFPWRARLVNARDNGGKALFKLTEIQGSLVTWKDITEITRAYDQALAFIDFLAVQYGARLLFDMVADCKEHGVDGAGLAFKRALLVDLDVVLGDFDASLR